MTDISVYPDSITVSREVAFNTWTDYPELGLSLRIVEGPVEGTQVVQVNKARHIQESTDA